MNSTMKIVDGPSLPRSIRWRLQMGLLNLPKDNLSLCDQNRQNIRLQRDRYLKLVSRHQRDYNESKEELRFGKATTSPAVLSASVDPLTAAVQHLEALEMKDKVKTQTAERRRSTHTAHRRRSKCTLRRLSDQLVIDTDPFSSTERLEVIQKDIARLDPEHAQHYHSRVNWQRLEAGLDPQSFSQSLVMRNSNLMQVLHTYANQYGTYHQGMHEVASYLMFAMDIDLFDLGTSPRDGFSHLLNNDCLLHDTYTLFEALMVPLGRCYEESATMSNSVVSKIPYVARDKELYNHIQAVPMSHEVYCAKWVRLMFSREVSSWRNVLCLWDVFFDLTTEEPSITSMDKSQYTRPGLSTPLQVGAWELEEVLEMTAASMIWLKRKELLSENAERAVEILVSYQSLENVAPLLGTLLSSLHRIQTNEHMAPLRLPSKKNIHDQDGIKNKLMGMTQRRAMRIERRKKEDQDRPMSLTIHRHASIQNLMDQSTCVSLLITDSEDSEDEDDCYSTEDELYSFGASHDDNLDFESINVEKEDASQCKRAPGSPESKAGITLLSLIGRGRTTGTSQLSMRSVELRAMGSSIAADDEFSLGDELSEAVREIDKITEEPDSSLQSLTMTVDDKMALCMGMSMAF